MDGSELREKLREKKWKQGSLIDEFSSIKSALSESVDDIQQPKERDQKKGVLVVVSQDCDVLAHTLSMNGELYVELVFAKPQKKDNFFEANLRNPRKLQFHLRNEKGEDETFTTNIHRKFRIPREKLLGLKQAANVRLPSRQLELLREWLGRRYTRAALPDSFESAISKPQRESILVELKGIVDCIDNIWIRLHPWGEISESEQYGVELLAVVNITDGNSMVKTNEALSNIKSVLEESSEIDSRSIDVYANYRDEVTLGTIAGMRIWDFERLSYEDTTAVIK